ncbi:hypothetical protein [Streptomyces sp. NPDC051016]|uniref:hypothetical protein n=1 Tax=Streptomyces sp. NPDC051016 TaxID=3365638 RepID=UPI00379C99E1
MTARPEAIAAAEWWANRLANPASHDVGAETANIVTNTVAALVERQRSQAQLEAFREALVDEIDQHVAQYSWRPDEPDFGSALRAIAVDYGPDPVLADAAERAGFELKILDLPMKTVMWINPGTVTVAEGYSAQPVVIWRADQ